MKRISVFCVASILLTSQHVWAASDVESSDFALIKSCREYEKAAHGQTADQTKAQECRAFFAGYLMGWQNRQNTPSVVVPLVGCVLPGKETERLIQTYLAHDTGAAIDFPPSISMMGLLMGYAPCPKSPR